MSFVIVGSSPQTSQFNLRSRSFIFLKRHSLPSKSNNFCDKTPSCFKIILIPSSACNAPITPVIAPITPPSPQFVFK